MGIIDPCNNPCMTNRTIGLLKGAQDRVKMGHANTLLNHLQVPKNGILPSPCPPLVGIVQNIRASLNNPTPFLDKALCYFPILSGGWFTPGPAAYCPMHLDSRSLIYLSKSHLRRSHPVGGLEYPVPEDEGKSPAMDDAVTNTD